MVFNRGRVVCPVSCPSPGVKRQEDGGQEGVPLEDIFFATLGASLVNNIFMMNFGNNNEATTTPAPTITTPPNIDSSTVSGMMF